MATKLSVDLLYAIGDTINSRSTLAALCRVSKAFNHVFTPILYAKIHVQDCEFQPLLQRISALPSESHLRFTKTLHVGRNIPRLPFMGSGLDVDTCLEKMPELLSLEYVTLDLLLFERNLMLMKCQDHELRWRTGLVW